MKMQSNFTVNDTTTVENSTVTVIFYTPIVNENVTANDTSSMAMQTPSWLAAGRVQIPLYAVIFLLAVIGNSLVILTLVQNKRMRTITNVFLLNLAVSDLLLGVLCMPFTLVGTLLRDFVFGELMCKFLPFLQAASVAVSAWTLVVISVERYYAICHPLRSRRWQTLSHSYKLIAAIWCGSLVSMSPIAFFSRLIPISQGHHKCREHWPDDAKDYERMYNLFLDVFLFVLPLLVLGITYSLITRTLWQGMRTERNLKNNQNSENQSTNNLVEVYIDAQGTPASRCPSSCRYQSSRDSVSWTQLRNHWSQESTRSRMAVGSVRKYAPGLRRSNAEKSLLNKKRVIQMLFVVVLEFFICWTPLYVINTMVLFEPGIVYNNLTSTEISFFHLLAYTSSCCNPITYCFMNRGFRKAFLNLFRCFKRLREPRRISLGGGGMGFGGGIGGPDQRSEAETTKLHNNHRLCTDSSY
ncbi:cholecystokinin receptor type A-like isoform X1 [Phlebotomus papatasi]|uniref:cholecystokinin receptor type A-like isoform X1 n=1 Tax=Phlebotomus papatasi TaxID=29031 RepID=UPI002484326F|nr:cholecystokinin receptor type A-like isoform X1 [Phlebotomus papatasi]